MHVVAELRLVTADLEGLVVAVQSQQVDLVTASRGKNKKSHKVI